MSTNSRIGYVLPDGNVESVYCHWDGYIGGVGSTLFEHFNNEESVKNIVSLGDMSSLARAVRVNPIGLHSYDWPEDGTIVFYHRDRGEDDVAPRTMSRQKFQGAESYVYLWENGDWYVSELGEKFILLATALASQVDDEPEEGEKALNPEDDSNLNVYHVTLRLRLDQIEYLRDGIQQCKFFWGGPGDPPDPNHDYLVQLLTDALEGKLAHEQ